MFASNDDYLSWELAQVNQRLAALKEARESTSRKAFSLFLDKLHEAREEGIQRRVESVKSQGIDIPFEKLRLRYKLSPEQESLLWICLAPHLSQGIYKQFLEQQNDPEGVEWRLGFIASLFGGASSAEARLPTILGGRGGTSFPGRAVLVSNPWPSRATSLPAHQLHSPHYVAAYVSGGHPLDPLLSTSCSLGDARCELFDVIMPKNLRRRVEDFIRLFRTPVEGASMAWRLMVTGARGTGKTSLAHAVAKGLGLRVLTVDMAHLINQRDVAWRLTRAFDNAAFAGALLHIVQPELLDEVGRGATSLLASHLTHHPGMVVLEPHRPAAIDQTFEHVINMTLELPRTTADERKQLWESLIPPTANVGSDLRLAHLATAYELSGRQIHDAIDWGMRSGRIFSADKAVRTRDLDAGARVQLRSKIKDLAEAVQTHLTLDDLVLPQDTMKAVLEFRDACLHRQMVLNDWGFGKRLVTGKGLVALFTGEAGTGKTLTTEILAGELDLQLHIVSVPKVVSKWVGETEKNIRQIFNHARVQNSMLLFDEADSFFATRVKVERSQDHFQNMEVNMLLQEIERFEGIVILTTNLATNIDRAFMRRILYKIDFPSPDLEGRERLWRVLLPSQMPLDEPIDFGALAKSYELTGGQIKNVVIRAAYQCAANKMGLSQKILDEAAYQQAREAGMLTRRK